MAWLAEIFRRGKRVCGVCRMGPTHLYGTDPAEPLISPDPSGGSGATPDDRRGDAADPASADPDAPTGAPLCNGCLAHRLASDLDRFEGRAIIFEPALGPGSLVFHSTDELPQPPDATAARGRVREALASMAEACSCGRPARFLWIPSPRDAGLWGGDWIAALADGTLSPTCSECGPCSARRLMDSIEKRGLYFESFQVPLGTGGVLLGDDEPV